MSLFIHHYTVFHNSIVMLKLSFRNLWTGNLFLQAHDLTSHMVVLVDWTHAQYAPLTTDVIHLLFSCCGSDIAQDMTEALNDYYDYLKVILLFIPMKCTITTHRDIWPVTSWTGTISALTLRHSGVSWARL